ncbi:MAG: hypothetical protein E7033_00530 [Akkermansiaceae bacterium]|nr:hypothetical protein [Akkermansiaceae bacterium]
MKYRNNKRCLFGFTLMETLLALALVSTLVSIFLVVFVPARGMVQSALAKQDTDRLVGVLRGEFKTIRNDERTTGKSSATKYASAFDKAFYWIKKTGKPESAILIYSYREDLSQKPRKDGTRKPIPAYESIPGETSHLITIACPVDDPIHEDELRDAVGPVYLVRLTMQEYKGDKWERVSKPGDIAGAGSPAEYLAKCDKNPAGGAALLFVADFFLLQSSDARLLAGKKWSDMGKPIFSANMSVSNN